MKKILILFNENRNLDSYPYVLNMIKLLSANNCSIDFLGNKQMYQDLNIDNFNFYSLTETDPYRKEYAKICIDFLKKEKKLKEYVRPKCTSVLQCANNIF